MPSTNNPVETLNGTFFFDPEDPIYADHFPGNPVVPGSLIVYAFMLAGRGFTEFEPAGFIENFRFKRFAIPGEYAYKIEVSRNQIKCTLYDGRSVVATGTLKV